MSEEQKVKKPIYKRWWFWVIIVVLVIGIGGSSLVDDENPNGKVSVEDASGDSGTESASSGNTSEPKTEDYEAVEEPQIIEDGYLTYIVGSLKNNKGRTLSYSQITFNLYDANGAQVDTALDNINNWEAGGVWKYKAAILSPDNVDSFKLIEVSGF